MNENMSLIGKRIAFLVADGFEQVELTGPLDAVKQAGAETAIVSPNRDQVTGWMFANWGESFDVDVD